MAIDFATAERLDELARQNRRLKKWLAVVTAWLVIGWLFGGCDAAPPEMHDAITARSLTIVDHNGNAVAQLDAGPSQNQPAGSLALRGGGSQVLLRAEEGQARVAVVRGQSELAIEAGPVDSIGLLRGKAFMGMAVDDSGRPTLSAHDRQGKLRLTAGISGAEDGRAGDLMVYDAQERLKWSVLAHLIFQAADQAK